MTAALTGAVELLDRSLAYTRVALAAVEHTPAATRTPCRGWPLHRLLAHMEDSLDAYTEAAAGQVSLTQAPAGSPLDAIRSKACALLGWWLDHPAETIAVGDRWLPADVLVGAAALEIALHGSDLHAAAGRPTHLPDDLAVPLLGVARTTAPGAQPCFGQPVTVTPGAPASRRLLAYLGRT